MLRALLSLLCASVPVLAEDLALVRATDVWRYHPVSTNYVQPREGWQFPEYNDAPWLMGVASFMTLVTGIPGVLEATYLTYPASPTYVFRKSFNLDDPDFIRWLTLRIDYENGFVAYLNGHEIARRGFPNHDGIPVPLMAEAAYHPRGPTELIDVSPHLDQLKSGTNLLALQVHSAGTNHVGVVLVAELVANFVRGPFIQNTTTNSTLVIWHTHQPTTGFVVYGPENGAAASIALSSDSKTNHAVKLTGLEPGQPYRYRVYAQSGSEVATHDWQTFRPLKMPGSPISFLVVGDTGQATPAQYRIASQMNQNPADLVMHVGDVIYPWFAAIRADARCFSIYRDQMRSVPWFLAMGNHDNLAGPTDYYDAFHLPVNNVTGQESFYSFDHGDAHFVVVAADTAAGYRYTPGSTQYNWIEADLRASNRPWKFLFFHHVTRSSSFHTHDDYLLDGVLDKYQLQDTIGALAAQHGAQFIFNGHDHNYERFAAFDGVNCIVSGGGGASLYGQAIADVGSAQFQSRHNFLRVSIDGPQLTLEAIDDNGVVFDRFYRSHAPGAAEPYPASWASPTIEASIGTDTAGNIPGQLFDFAGPAIPTRSGLSANLGRLHVRNDKTYLYLGFESLSLREFQVAALFLEDPAHPGVSDLGPLGNNQLDPAPGEGDPDGLDLLQKLGFNQFQPSVAVLFGDEWADHTAQPRFKRPMMRWAAGQGAFRLDSTFTPVPDARLQQFNRSPQTAATLFPESNADFVEIAIPLREFDPLAAPATLRLGAIVFGDPGSDPIEPAFDTAYLGQSLDPAGDGRLLLQPITIRLAPNPDPNDDLFEFRAELLSNTHVRFTWNSIPGAAYRLQSTPALGQPFTDLDAPPITANTAQTTFDLPINTIPSPHFFRLRTN